MLPLNLLMFSEDMSEFSIFSLHNIQPTDQSFSAIFKAFDSLSRPVYEMLQHLTHCYSPTPVENAEADCTQIEIVLAVKWELIDLFPSFSLLRF